MMTPAHPPPTSALAKRPRDIRQILRGGFDWIDAVSIVPMGVVLYVIFGQSGIDFFLKTGGGASFGLLIFAPFVLRRAVFGSPKRGEMRRGVLWSAAGVVGLLSIVLGTGVAALAIWGYAQRAGRPEPDWAAQIRASPPLVTVVPVVAGESPEASERRMQAAREQYEQSYLAEAVPERHAQWLKELAEARMMALKMGGVGVLLIALGAVLDGIRYRRRVPEP